jgi:putative CocE/NonD family hydrolase
MSLLSRVMSAALQLPTALTRDLTIEHDLTVPMSDGILLRADRYAPRGSQGLPVVLIRSPYGRKGVLAELWARPFAERGFQALIQSVRGTFGSEGRFEPHHHEHADGLATLAWIKQQPWFGGAIFTFGQSYLGYTQWAIARDAGPELKALATQISTAHFAHMTYAGGSFSLRNALGWARVVTHQEDLLAPLLALRELGAMGDPLRAVWRKRPVLAEADVLAAGQRVEFFQDWLKYASPDDPWWRPLDFQRSLAEVDKPVCMVAGWDDIFTPWQLQDFSIMQEAGRDVQLLVGPWKHLDPPVNAYAIRDALEFFRAQLTGDRSRLRATAVRVYVTGADAFRDFDRWPPRQAQPERLYLQPRAALSRQLPAASAADCYTYNPSDPTPALGGPTLTLDPVRVDNRPLEARADVLKYTSEPLPRDLDVIGPVAAELWVSSDRETCDFFVRMCEVSPSGRSQNVCDGLARVRFAESSGPQRVLVTLWPTAHRFRAGFRLRVHISGGAYPRWAINPGTIDALGADTPRLPQRQQIYHGPEHPSALVLSVVHA